MPLLLTFLLLSLFASSCCAALGKLHIVRNDAELSERVKIAKPGDIVRLEPGLYQKGIIIKTDNLTLEGYGAHFVGASTKGKATFIVKGDLLRIVGLECSGVEVGGGNGACVRQQSSTLFLKDVFFHDSQQGVLTGNSAKLLQIEDSRFERLGFGGRAHGVYFGGKQGELVIRRSEFLRSKGQGHEIKSRGKRTLIEHSVIASLDGEDSRLLDVSNGGELILRDSVLQQGPNSSNNDVIGFGLETHKFSHAEHRIEMLGNLFLLDKRRNRLLHTKPKKVSLNSSGNVVAGSLLDPDLAGFQRFSHRDALQLSPYPWLPNPVASR